MDEDSKRWDVELLRDPRHDPEPGDVLYKRVNGKLTSRHVVRRDGGDVYYRTGSSKHERKCWITTWREWTRTATTEPSAPISSGQRSAQ